MFMNMCSVQLKGFCWGQVPGIHDYITVGNTVQIIIKYGIIIIIHTYTQDNNVGDYKQACYGTVETIQHEYLSHYFGHKNWFNLQTNYFKGSFSRNVNVAHMPHIYKVNKQIILHFNWNLFYRYILVCKISSLCIL